MGTLLIPQGHDAASLALAAWTKAQGFDYPWTIERDADTVAFLDPFVAIMRDNLAKPAPVAPPPPPPPPPPPRRRKNWWERIFGALALVVLLPMGSFAHPGRLDAKGCHQVHTRFEHDNGKVDEPGTSHCHRQLGEMRLDGQEQLENERDDRPAPHKEKEQRP